MGIVEDARQRSFAACTGGAGPERPRHFQRNGVPASAMRWRCSGWSKAMAFAQQRNLMLRSRVAGGAYA